MAQRSGTACPASSIGNTAISTTVRKTPLSPFASANGGCRGSNPQGMPNASWPQVVLSRNTSACDATASPPRNTVKRWETASPPSRKSRRFPLLHKRDDSARHASSCELTISTGNKLTTPGESFLACPLKNQCMISREEWKYIRVLVSPMVFRCPYRTKFRVFSGEAVLAHQPAPSIHDKNHTPSIDNITLM